MCAVGSLGSSKPAHSSHLTAAGWHTRSAMNRIARIAGHVNSSAQDNVLGTLAFAESEKNTQSVSVCLTTSSNKYRGLEVGTSVPPIVCLRCSAHSRLLRSGEGRGQPCCKLYHVGSSGHIWSLLVRMADCMNCLRDCLLIAIEELP